MDFPVFLGNDATSACGAELTFGTTKAPADFLYIYIGYFVGGGVVLNGAVYAGRTGNAGAVGPFPVASHDGSSSQLVDKASLIGLERRLATQADGNVPLSRLVSEYTDATNEVVEAWLDEAVKSLAQLILGACSIIDFPAVLVDGNMPAALRERIVARVTEELDEMPLSGLIRPDLIEGSLGAKARPLGAASLPLSNRFMLQT